MFDRIRNSAFSVEWSNDSKMVLSLYRPTDSSNTMFNFNPLEHGVGEAAVRPSLPCFLSFTQNILTLQTCLLRMPLAL